MNCKTVAKKDGAELGDCESRHTTRPRVDIRETADAVYVEAEMAGVSRDDVDVKLEDGELRILGRIAAPEPEDHSERHIEHRLANYERVFRLSEEINADKIAATMKNGVLLLRLPKREAVKPKSITVKVA